MCLEVGCGTGLVSAHLAPLTLRTHGVDISQGMIDVYNRKAEASEQLRGRMVGSCLRITNPEEVTAAQADGKLPADEAVQVCAWGWGVCA